MIISICDDSSIARRVIKDMVLLYKERRKIPDLEVLEYDSPIPLEEDLKKIESDIYLLDIFFRMAMGLSLQRRSGFAIITIRLCLSPVRVSI